MNGWTATATMSSANGDGWGVIVGSNQTSHIRLFLGFYVSATDTVRLVANFNVSAAGEAADPTYTVTTGGNLDVEIRVDCDRPAASNGATVDYYIGGALAGSRVVSYTSSGYTYPALSPYYTSSAADNSATHNFYKRNTTTISADLMTRWDNDAATVAGAYGNTFSTTWRGTDCFAVRPPVGGNPFVIRSGEEFIARAKAAAVSGSGITAYIYQTSGVWTRPGPGQAWGFVERYNTGNEYLAPSTTASTWTHVMHGADEPRVFLDRTWFSLDGFLTALATGGGNSFTDRIYINEPMDYDGPWTSGNYCRLAPTAIATDARDRQGLAVKLDFRDGREQVYAVPSLPLRSRYTVASAVRIAGNDDSRPHPWVYRMKDGRWRVGWFCNDAPAEYVSDDLLGYAWTALSPTSDATAGYLNLVATNFWPGRDGLQAVAGYHFGNEKFVVLTRAGDGDAWTGPYLSVTSATAAAPYIYERRDGQWEVGWLIGGTWTRYTALHPAGTWSVV